MIDAKAISKLFILFASLWWILADGSFEQWWFGLIVAGMAVAATRWIGQGSEQDTGPLRLRALIFLAPMFLLQSFKGGVGVAAAALNPWRKVRPYYVSVRIRIGPDHQVARNALAAALALLPGTLSCRLDEDKLMLHVLDEGMLDIASIERFEALVAILFSSCPPQDTPRET